MSLNTLLDHVRSTAQSKKDHNSKFYTEIAVVQLSPDTALAFEAVARAGDEVVAMFSTMPWCKLGSIDSKTTCVHGSAWQAFNFGPMHRLFEALSALETQLGKKVPI